MRPFNIDEAKAGAPVCTRDGRDVRIICWDKKSSYSRPIVALIASCSWEVYKDYTETGTMDNDGFRSNLDLFMKDEEPKQCCGDACGDNRFEIIEKAKEALLKGTNIESSQEEMAVLDNFLFRCWQMGLLEQYGPTGAKVKEATLADYTTIKTYEDACKALDEEPIDFEQSNLVKGQNGEYKSYVFPKHIIAFMKLETISRALRNGWKPDKETELPYMPVFEEKMRCLGAYMSGSIPRLYQETEEKAEYFGTQFIDLWKEYLTGE